MSNGGCLSHDGFLCLGSYDGNHKASKDRLGLADRFISLITND
jgi:hypothetical protein